MPGEQQHVSVHKTANSLFIHCKKQKSLTSMARQFVSGAGGIRTLVQTTDLWAFYMLILNLIVGTGPARDDLTCPYPLRFSSVGRENPWLIPT